MAASSSNKRAEKKDHFKILRRLFARQFLRKCEAFLFSYLTSMPPSERLHGNKIHVYVCRYILLLGMKCDGGAEICDSIEIKRLFQAAQAGSSEFLSHFVFPQKWC